MSNEINVNTDTSTQVEPIREAAGSSTVSFDQLEQVMDSAKDKREKSEPKKEAKKKEEEEVESDVSEESEEETTKEIENGKEESKEKGKESLLKSKEQGVRSYKVKSGDATLDLRADTLVPVKINGKDETVPFQELMNNYSGKTAWDKKFTELSKEKQNFERDRGALQEYIDTLHTKLIKEKDAYGAVWLLAEAMGGKPHTIMQEFQEQILAKANELSELTPEERELRKHRDTLALYKKNEEEMDRTRSAVKERKQLEEKIYSSFEKYGMSEGDFHRVYTKLVEANKIDPNKLPIDIPDLIGKEFQLEQKAGSVSEMVKEINDSLDDYETPTKELLKIMNNFPEMGIEDLKDIAMQVYGDSKAQRLSQKLKKTKPADTSKQSMRRPDDAWSFDQISV